MDLFFSANAAKPTAPYSKRIYENKIFANYQLLNIEIDTDVYLKFTIITRQNVLSLLSVSSVPSESAPSVVDVVPAGPVGGRLSHASTRRSASGILGVIWR